jgi:hypothetical protein
MSGRLGGVKIVILPNRDHVEGDPANSHTHTMFFQDGSPTQPRGPHKAERGRSGGPIEDDPLPF